MKVLFIGHYREGSGWAQAAIDWILALDAAGVDVVCRPVKLNNENPEIPERIRELEAKNIRGCDYCIQNILPHMMDYNGNFKKNIGMFFLETMSMKYTGWPCKLACMDEVWVPNYNQYQACINSNIFNIKIIPCATDISKFKNDYKKYHLPEILDNTFKFYFIGEHIRRKHLAAALVAYYTSFTKYDNVSLIIKSNKSGYTPEQCLEEIEQNIKAVKNQLRMYDNHEDYPIHCTITGKIEEGEIYSLHQQCDCFLMPSFGEGWCFTPGTKINTINGLKSIEHLSLNDIVYTHLGNIKRITRLLKRNYYGKIVSIKAKGVFDTIDSTPNHTHYIVKRNNKKFSNITLSPQFIEASMIEKGDLVAIPKLSPNKTNKQYIKISDFVDVNLDKNGNIVCNHSYKSKNGILKNIAKIFNCSFQTVSKAIHKQRDSKLCKNIIKYINDNNIEIQNETIIPNKIELTKDIMFMIGHYIAEGSVGKSKIYFTTHKNEQYGRNITKKAIKDTFGIDCTEQTYGNTTELIFCNKIIGIFLQKLCGKNSLTKFIHNDLKHSKNLDNLLRGLFYGDGSFTNNSYGFYTSSETLKNDIIETMNINNIFMMYYAYKRDSLSNIQYQVRCPSQFNDRFNKLINPIKYNSKIVHKNKIKQRYILEDNNYFYSPVSDIKEIDYNGKVYNISVEDDESYLANFIATHNCIPAFDAMGFGNWVIANKCGGMIEFLDGYNKGILVNNSIQPVVGYDMVFTEMNTGRDFWSVISIDELAERMRDVYKNKNSEHEKIDINKWSYKSIGQLMKKELENV